MSDELKRPLWPWTVAVLVVVPVLYVLSSGPMRSLAFRSIPLRNLDGTTDHSMGGPVLIRDEGMCWPIAYAPLVWVSEQPWGESAISWYWDLFPIPTSTEPID